MAQFAVLMLAMQQGLLAMRVLPEAELIWLALPFALAALGYPRLRWLGAGVLGGARCGGAHCWPWESGPRARCSRSPHRKRVLIFELLTVAVFFFSSQTAICS